MKKLSAKDIHEIYTKFVKNKCRVCCNEAHAHRFDCVEFATEEAKIIERLRVEVILLQKKLADITNIVKN